MFSDPIYEEQVLNDNIRLEESSSSEVRVADSVRWLTATPHP